VYCVATLTENYLGDASIAVTNAVD